MDQRVSRLLGVAAFAAACLLDPSTAKAQPTTLVPGPFIGRPSCASWGDALWVNCTARGVDNVLRAFWFEMPAASGSPLPFPMETLTTIQTLREPSCVNKGNRETTCAVVGVDNALYGFALFQTFDATATKPPFHMTNAQRLSGPVAGNPSCANTGAWVTCAVVDLNNALVGIRFNGFTDHVFGQVLGGTVVDNPSCAPTRDGLYQVICAVRGTNGALFGIRFDPWTGFSSGFKELGGNFVGSPSCANSGQGNATCVVRDEHNALVGVRFAISPSGNGMVASLLQHLGGTWVGDPSCAPARNDTVVCLGRDTDNNMEAIRINPSTGFSSGFQGVGQITSPGRGDFTSDASCAQFNEEFPFDGVICVGRRTDDNAVVGFVANP